MSISGVPRGVVRENGVAQPEVVGGARLSLAELYERSAPGAIRLAYLLTGDRSVAEDITQDAFVRVSGRLAHLREGERSMRTSVERS